MEIRKIHLCLIGFFTGLFGFFFLPYGFKFIGFIIPVLCLSVVFSSKEDYFNIHILIILLGVFVLLPSNLLTFDAREPVNISTLITGVYAMVNIIVFIALVGVPIIMIVVFILAVIQGKANQAVTVLVRFIVFMFFAMMMVMMMAYAGMDFTGGMSGYIIDLYLSLIVIAFEVPMMIYNLINTILLMFNTIMSFIEEAINNLDAFDAIEDIVLPRAPLLPSLPDVSGQLRGISFDSSQQNMNSQVRNYPEIIYTIHDSLPILMSLICLVVSPFLIRKEWEENLEEVITKIAERKEPKKKKGVYLPNVNMVMLFYMFFLIFFAFIIYLAFENSFGGDPREDARYFGFFTVYMFMAIVPLILFQFQDFTYYKDSNIYNTLEGTAYGTIVLFLLMRLFFTMSVVQAYSAIDWSGDVAYLVNTFVFIAPAESIFFHIFYPALVAGAIRRYFKKKRAERIEISNRDMVLENELEIIHEKRRADVYKDLGYTRDYVATIEYIEVLEEEKMELQSEFDVNISEKMIFGRSVSSALFMGFGMIGGAFLFSIIHWIIPYVTTGMDFITFWTCGLGIIFFAGGCWFIYIGIRYGWLACVLTHAIYNTSTIILVILVSGV